jgi:hypothetical protein
MGAILSLPLAPVSILGSWLSSCLGVSLCSCCMNKNVNPLMNTFKSSIATRIMYAVIFMFNSIISWIALSNSLTKFVEKLTWGLFKFGNKFCKDEQGCIGFTSVQRINFSLGILHLILAFLLIGVKSTKNPRAVIQNGYWMTKIFILWTFIITSYLIPDKFFIIWGNYFSIIFSTIFIGIGLILLVDFAHEWAETCIEKIEEGEIYLDINDNDDNNFCNFSGVNFWKKLLIGGTLIMYLGVIIMTVLMYIYFAQDGCSMNKTVITINLLFTIIITGLSITPIVQEYNPNAGLAQSSMCCVYCTYLVFSACLSEPDDKLCNPLIRSAGTRTITVIIGAIFTFGAVAYTTTRAAANSAFNHESLLDTNHHPLNNLIEGDEENNVITEQPNFKRNMRYQALRQAVNEGSLPESALSDSSYYDDLSDDNDDDDVENRNLGEEKNYTKYSYVLFHIIFFLATQYIAALLTINVGVTETDNGMFIPVGRTYFNTWLKIVSSWVCFALYGWTLLAPSIFPDRFS